MPEITIAIYWILSSRTIRANVLHAKEKTRVFKALIVVLIIVESLAPGGEEDATMAVNAVHRTVVLSNEN